MFNYVISFFRPSLLFNIRPLPLIGTGLKIMLTWMGMIFVVGLILRVVSKKQEDQLMAQVARKFSKPFVKMSIVGFFYTWFMYEAIPILSMRVWFLVWIALFTILLFFPTQYFFVMVPRIKKEQERKKSIEPYLP